MQDRTWVREKGARDFITRPTPGEYIDLLVSLQLTKGLKEKKNPTPQRGLLLIYIYIFLYVIMFINRSYKKIYKKMKKEEEEDILVSCIILYLITQ